MRTTCPTGTEWVGAPDSGELQASVNGRVEGGCARPDGTQHGPATVWYEDGSKAAQGEYKEGLKEGKWRFWHENGQISGHGNFIAGKPDGTWRTWHDNGQRESQGSYRDGAHHGRFVYWTRDGQIDKELVFEFGKLIETASLGEGERES